MKRQLMVLFIGLLVLTMVPAQQPSNAAPVVPKNAEIVIKYAHEAAPGVFGSIEESWANVFKNVLSAKTEGKVAVVIYPSAQLGNQSNVSQGVKMGTIQMGSISAAVLEGFYPKAAIFSVPFAFDTYKEVVDFAHSDFIKAFNDDCAKTTGIRPVSVQTFGFRGFMNNRRPIKSPADLKGLKIRVMQSPTYIKMMELMGAIPAALPMSEVYGAIQSGVIDALENPPTVLAMWSLQEVQKYFSDIGYVAGVQTTIINNAFYEKLSPAYKKAFQEAIEAADIAGLGFAYMSNYGNALNVLSAKSEIYMPTKEEKEVFKKLLVPEVKKIIAKTVGAEYLEQALAAIDGIK